MIDGLLCHKISTNLKEKLKNGKVTRVFEVSKDEVIFKIRAQQHNYILYNNISSNNYTLHLSNHRFSNPSIATNNTMSLRKYVEGAIIEDIYQYENDRIITFKIRKANEIRDIVTSYLVFELLGRHANLFILDTNNIIKYTQRFKPLQLETNSRLLQVNLMYEYPLLTKLNPLNDIEECLDYTLLYQGIGAPLNKQLLSCNDPKLLIQEYINSNNIYVSKKCLSYLPLDEATLFHDLDLALDSYFFSNNNQKINSKLKSSLLIKLTNARKKAIKKVVLLQKRFEDNQINLKYQNRATLLYENLYRYDKNKHYQQVSVMDYELNQDIIITLD
ncbi:MAG: NFACT family protein, partial [Bacilli bacterium]